MEKLSKREKIMLGVTVIAVGAAGYFGFKYMNNNNLLKLKKSEIGKIKEEQDLLKFLVIESDCVPKALQNAENKLSRKETKIKELVETLQKCPNKTEIKIAIEKHEKEAAILRYQINNTSKLQNMIMNDENIYAK